MIEDKENEFKENPISRFGFGISAWIKLLSFLFKLLCGLSVLAIGLAYYYKSKGHLKGGGRYEFLAQMSLGNIGSAQTICLSQFVNFHHARVLSCEKGVIGNLTHLGAHTGDT